MKNLSILLQLFFLAMLFAVNSNRQNQAKPSEVQYKWHEQERLMFAHYALTTWTEKEQNDHSNIIPSNSTYFRIFVKKDKEITEKLFESTDHKKRHVEKSFGRNLMRHCNQKNH